MEKDKLEIKKNFERERQRIKINEDVAEEQKTKLLAELQEKEENQNKAQSKQTKLLKRIKNMEEKLLHGNEAMQKAMK